MGLYINPNRAPGNNRDPGRGYVCRHVAGTAVSRAGGRTRAHDRQVITHTGSLGEHPQVPQAHRFFLAQTDKLFRPSRIAGDEKPPTCACDTFELDIDIDGQGTLTPPAPLRQPINLRVPDELFRYADPPFL
jgi:hypothetical protein